MYKTVMKKIFGTPGKIEYHAKSANTLRAELRGYNLLLVKTDQRNTEKIKEIREKIRKVEEQLYKVENNLM
jgi:predicted transcriptional regulator